MTRMGLLEAMARADLEVLAEEMARDYSPGALELLSAADPEWRAALDRAERDLGAIYEALLEADGTRAEWRRAIAVLRELWARAKEVPRVRDQPRYGDLEEVA